jgi:hypothetical protein
LSFIPSWEKKRDSARAYMRAAIRGTSSCIRKGGRVQK